jgi:hypothetical protein
MNMEEAIKKISEQQQRIALETHQRQQQAAAEKMVETLVKILSSSYDKAIAYNNVVIVAGYATFFALWGATKPALTHWISITSALLMVSSATVFVLFELFKMVQSSRTFLRLQSIASDDNARKDPEVFQSKVKEFEASQRTDSLRFLRVWVAVLGFTVSTAVVDIALLVYNYIYVLIQ